MSFDRKDLTLLLSDLAAIFAAAFGANYLRFDRFYPSEFVHFERWLIIDLILTPVVFYLMGLYRRSWRYASINDLKVIVAAVGVRTLGLISLFIFLGYDRGVPRSTIMVQAILVLGGVGGSRLLIRVRRELSRQKTLRGKPPVLIVGAGDTGEIILRELRNNRSFPYNPIGFVDDNMERWGERIHGVPVLGGTADIPRIAFKRKVRDVIIAIPSASGRELKQIYMLCKAVGMRTKTVPMAGELHGGRLYLSQIRNVELEDLLGREAVRVDLDVISGKLAGKRVLITGGAGSIGRELARQVAGFGPELLVVLDRNENSIYFTELDLRKRFPGVALECAVGDVLDRTRLDDIMERCAPQIVFHAAAFKHVPMMEANAAEAFKNNVLGTRNVAEKAARLNAERFVLISTDKAVNPVSVMGGTKRLAEMALSEIPASTRFMSVRFGNVLGSDGSVVPLFKKQIAEGGPVTVTHPEVTRYFMTISEAVHLVLQAGSMGKGGEVFLLDMGEPIRIVDLARNLIELSGFKPDEEIEILYSGLRPGEKLHEELYLRGEEWEETSHEKIMRLRSNAGPPPGLTGRLDMMARALQTSAGPEMEQVVRALMADLIPDFGGEGSRNSSDVIGGRTLRTRG